MQAVILAGGLGTRLGEKTRDRQKCMIQVAGLPFLEHLLKRWIACDVRNFVLAVGFYGEQVQDYFGDGSRWKCRIQYSVEHPPKGTGGALKEALPLLENEFVLSNGDTILDVSCQQILNTFARHPEWAGLMTIISGSNSAYSANTAIQGNRVLSYNYENPAGKNGLDAGIKIFRKSVSKYFPNREIFSLEKDVMPHFVENEIVGVFPVRDYPLDIGHPEKLEEARRILEMGFN
ncbi:MAG: NTP transferase domain-containing protein [Candidatus Omnitrophica bacterium]|nr:NTP transferase domain-containing protein [Candidatus Omnitrophota bacterium]